MPTERRKTVRVGLAIPLRVQGFLADGGTWEEITNTVDVSQGGACFALTHEAELGQVLLLSLPMPKRLRQPVASMPRSSTQCRRLRRSPASSIERSGLNGVCAAAQMPLKCVRA